ncbi:MAG: YdcF family protein [Aggregatilineales bacterium]
MKKLLKQVRFKHILRFAFITGVIWIVVMIALGVGVNTYGVTENAETSDVIIVLGSGLRRDGRPGDALLRRSRWGAQLYADGLAPTVICTGGVGQNAVRSESSACREVLIREGVPEEAIFVEEQSKSTEENAIYAQAIMLENDWTSAVIVTDSFHMLRANWIFNTYFDENNIHHTRSPVPRDWVRSYFYTRHSLREIVALQWQAFKEIFNLPITAVPG